MVFVGMFSWNSVGGTVFMDYGCTPKIPTKQSEGASPDFRVNINIRMK